jgi:phasin
MKLSIEQAKQAFESFAATSEKTWKSLETTSEKAGVGIWSLNEKIVQITRSNAEANFAIALKLAGSKDFGQAMQLQADHARKQLETFVRQLEEVRDLAAKIIEDAVGCFPNRRADLNTETRAPPAIGERVNPRSRKRRKKQCSKQSSLGL